MDHLKVLLIGVAALALAASACGDDNAPTIPSPKLTTETPTERLAFSIQGNVYSVRPDGSELRRIVGPDSEAYSAPEYSPDGERLAYVADRRRVVVVGPDAATVFSDIDLYVDRTPPTPIASDWSMGPVAVHWSPDGTKLLVTRQRLGGSGVSDVLLVNPDGTDLRLVREAGVFIEGTWWQPPEGEPLVVVVAADASMRAITYDLDGGEVGRALPAAATRPAVASLQSPDGKRVLVRSTLGSPEPFGPIEIENASGASIAGGGCGATWSPDGERIAFYNGYGIAIKDPDAPPDDVDLIVSNADLGVGEAGDLREELCIGLGISWSASTGIGATATPVATPTLSSATNPYRNDELGIEFEYLATWVEGAAWMPYASCFGCVVLGPPEASPRYGVYLLETADLSGPGCGGRFGGCPVTAFFTIRALPDGQQEAVTVAGHEALQQRMLRQPPVGLTNSTGEQRLYREISTAIDTEAGGLLIMGFYREDDAAAEREVTAAYEALLASMRVD